MRWYESSAVPDSVPPPDRERKLELYKYDSCGYCALVLRALQRMPEVQVTLYDTIRDPLASARLRQATGRTQVPCLFVDGQPLLESADIVRWLEAYQEWRNEAPTATRE